MLILQNQKLDVQYHEELEPYLDRLSRVRYRGEKLQCCSPFRHERNPSFAVNLANGTWIDSGADSEDMRKGSFITLLAFLREENVQMTGDYLIDKYGRIYDDMDALKLSVELVGQQSYQTFNLEGIVFGSSYLESRGISKATQELFGVFETNGAVAIPWINHTGDIINIKYRQIDSKKFWYQKDGYPIKNFTFGLYQLLTNSVIQNDLQFVYIVESEIDAMYLWEVGIPAVATGGSSLSEAQERLIRQLPISKLIIATDNDTVGHRFAQFLIDTFKNQFNVYRFKFPEGVKDVNEIRKELLPLLHEQVVVEEEVIFKF